MPKKLLHPRTWLMSSVTIVITKRHLTKIDTLLTLYYNEKQHQSTTKIILCCPSWQNAKWLSPSISKSNPIYTNDKNVERRWRWANLMCSLCKSFKYIPFVNIAIKLFSLLDWWNNLAITNFYKFYWNTYREVIFTLSLSKSSILDLFHTKLIFFILILFTLKKECKCKKEEYENYSSITIYNCIGKI